MISLTAAADLLDSRIEERFDVLKNDVTGSEGALETPASLTEKMLDGLDVDPREAQAMLEIWDDRITRAVASGMPLRAVVSGSLLSALAVGLIAGTAEREGAS